MIWRTDKIRAQHDKGKKRKVTDFNQNQREKKLRVQHNKGKRKRKDSVDLKQSKIKFGKYK